MNKTPTNKTQKLSTAFVNLLIIQWLKPTRCVAKITFQKTEEIMPRNRIKTEPDLDEKTRPQIRSAFFYTGRSFWKIFATRNFLSLTILSCSGNFGCAVLLSTWCCISIFWFFASMECGGLSCNNALHLGNGNSCAPATCFCKLAIISCKCRTVAIRAGSSRIMFLSGSQRRWLFRSNWILSDMIKRLSSFFHIYSVRSFKWNFPL